MVLQYVIGAMMLNNIFIGVIVVLLAFSGVQTIRLQKEQLAFQSYKHKVENANKEKTKEWKKAVYEISYKSAAERRQREAELQNIIDDLRHPSKPAVRYVVRERFSCPNASSPSGRNDAEAGRGLSTEDVEFLLREARRADSVVETLQMCQNYVETITDGVYSRQE